MDVIALTTEQRPEGNDRALEETPTERPTLG
jgi:hypothetical protein